MTGVFPRGTALVLDHGSPLVGAVVATLTEYYPHIVVASDADSAQCDGGAGSGSACDLLDVDLATVTGQARVADYVRQTPELALVVNLLDAPVPGNGLDRQFALLRRWCDATVVVHAALASIATGDHRPRLLNVVRDSGECPVTDPVLVASRAFVRTWTQQCRSNSEAHPCAPAVEWLEVEPATLRQLLLAAAGVA